MKNITYILLLFSLSVFGQRPNNFNDSTNFARPVRFAVPPYIIQGAGNGKVLTSDASGRATWQTFSSAGVSQGALNDSINAVRSIRKVDTLYRNLDSLVFKINGIRYAIKDSSGGIDVDNFIPLSGTASGSPVTGDIEFGGDIAIKTLNGDGNNFHSLTFSDGAIISKFNNNIYETALSVSDDILIFSGNPNFKGIVGNNDWSSNYTDSSYTQKIYVDQRISDTATQIRSEIADTASSLHTLIDTKVSASGTATLTNKRITARVDSTTSSATPSINTDNVDTYKLTAQAADITSFTTNLSGTPTDDQILHIVIIGTGARAITWGSKFESSTVTLPTTTVSTNRLDVYFIWNTAVSKWRCGGVW